MFLQFLLFGKTVFKNTFLAKSFFAEFIPTEPRDRVSPPVFPWRPEIPNFRDRLSQGLGAIAGELLVDGFESMNEIDDAGALQHSAGGGAEMGPAAEGTVGVNLAATVFAEKGTGAVGGLIGGHGLPPRRAPTGGGDDGFAACELGRSSGETKSATLRPSLAVALGGPLREIGIDLPNLTHGRAEVGRITAGGGDGGIPALVSGAGHEREKAFPETQQGMVADSTLFSGLSVG